MAHDYIRNGVRDGVDDDPLTPEQMNEYRRLVEFIATDYHELSFEKVKQQRDDWKKRCKRLIEEHMRDKPKPAPPAFHDDF